MPGCNLPLKSLIRVNEPHHPKKIGTGAGVLGDLVVIGVIGAIVGGWVFGLLGLASTSLI